MERRVEPQQHVPVCCARLLVSIVTSVARPIPLRPGPAVPFTEHDQSQHIFNTSKRTPKDSFAHRLCACEQQESVNRPCPLQRACSRERVCVALRVWVWRACQPSLQSRVRTLARAHTRVFSAPPSSLSSLLSLAPCSLLRSPVVPPHSATTVPSGRGSVRRRPPLALA